MQSLFVRWSRPYAIEPLVTFRILFGALMSFGALRFMYEGWIEKLYVEPRFFFKFYGFHWVEVWSETGMYALYCVVAVSAFLVMLGCFYRLSILVFFLSFTYSELADATNYLNHYYLVCILAFLLIFLPAHRAFSIDAWRKPAWKVSHVPAWCIYVLMLQIGIVYFYAGFAKLNTDWIFRAMPMAIWLPTKTDFPLIGSWFSKRWIAFAFSWAGAVYDLTITFFLLYRPTRPLAYLGVVVFHLMTKLLFNIGLFPFIMIFNTLIFFSPQFHQRLLGYLGYRPLAKQVVWSPTFTITSFMQRSFGIRLVRGTLIVHFLFQFLFPLRHYGYAGNVLWTEEGYRFSWRVMLVEKAGQTTFYIEDQATGQQSEVTNADYLTAFQEKQMSIQPDFILQFARHIAQDYQMRYGFQAPKVTVDSHVALNGRTSLQFIDPKVNLLEVQDNWMPKYWVLKHR
ncbi:MAG: HTTM domain-containing protein [Bacteroidota bacterium]